MSVDYAGLLRVVEAPLDGVGKAMIGVAKSEPSATHIGMLEFDIAADGRDFDAMRMWSEQCPEQIIVAPYMLYKATSISGDPSLSHGWGMVIFPKYLMLDNAEAWEKVDYTRDPQTGYARMDGPWWCWTAIKSPIICNDATPKHMHWISGERSEGHD
jgi:hypothetical protein